MQVLFLVRKLVDDAVTNLCCCNFLLLDVFVGENCRRITPDVEVFDHRFCLLKLVAEALLLVVSTVEHNLLCEPGVGHPSSDFVVRVLVKLR